MKKQSKIGSRKNAEFFDDMKKNLEVINDLVTMYCARETSERIEQKFCSIMQSFYDDYVPIYYYRSFGVRDLTHMKYYKKKGKNHYSGGISLTYEKLKQSDYNATTDYIFDIAVMCGWHYEPELAITNPPPYDSIVEYRDKLTDDFIRDRLEGLEIKKAGVGFALNRYYRYFKGGENK